MMKRYFSILTLIIMVMAPAILLHADDTAIYGSGSISVEPNILIIFDTSGSMSEEDVPSEYYDPATTYSGSYSSNAVYYKKWKKVYTHRGYYWVSEWVIFADDMDDDFCTAVKEILETEGQTEGGVYETSSGNFDCGGSIKSLQMGNYRNYEASVGDVAMKSRIDVAKEVVTDLIQDTEDVKFGLMRFSYSQGGRVIKAVQSVTGNETYKTELVTAVNGLPASGYTPLAETLAEAGLYFAGDQSWFNGKDSYSDDILTTSDTYTSPMDYRCQKNYVILMTDGDPTQDNDWRLKDKAYINGDKIGDYDNDENSGDSTSDSSSDYLDDVAQYLYTNDCNPELGAEDLTFETQNIITYTIGFQTDQQLLEDTAQNGGGAYYNVSSISGLSNAFKTILSKIKEVNASYVAPVIPVSDMNQAYSGDFLYLGFFMPSDGGRWLGNVKKYGINSDGDILDAKGIVATNTNGTIKDNAQSYWSNGADGPDVTKGGLGELLLDNTSRKIYTYLGPTLALTDDTNLFSTANSDLTFTDLDVADNTEKDDVITDIIGLTSDWKMGDIIHSQPLVVGYDTTVDDTTGDEIAAESYIFVGTNGGLMHAFKDSDGSEAWGFIPREHLSRLQLLSDSTEVHEYYMDAPPILYDDDINKILFFGERRGGHNYYALDITNPVAPVYKYTISQDILASLDSDDDGNVDGAAVYLGQSWASPTVHKIKTGTDTDENIFLMAGGYDENQDLDTPAVNDTKGKAVFAIDVTDGSLSALKFNSLNSSMTHCITDVMGYDYNEDGYTDRVYAGDLNGNIWAFEDEDTDPDDTIIGGDGTWSARKLFFAGGRKIFYSPDVVLEEGEDMIFFGTGDRADPEETGVVNRIYAVRNNWEDPTSASFTTLTESDLVDVTDNLVQVGTDAQKEAVETQLENSRGWFFELENPGEKIISSVLVINSSLYFTTYEPESAAAADPTDPCGEAGGLGVARLYTVNYETGGATQDYDDSTETDAAGNIVDYGTNDRSMVIGTSIPSGVVAAVTPTGINLFVGIGGGIIKVPPIKNLNMNRFYWRQR